MQLLNSSILSRRLVRNKKKKEKKGDMIYICVAGNVREINYISRKNIYIKAKEAKRSLLLEMKINFSNSVATFIVKNNSSSRWRLETRIKYVFLKVLIAFFR